ncbi:MAG: hypothetical protein KF833_13795 [Verrucomicrobiae bacterium]|nr:hypothetical protein [Verrucomicrobiae bacterium]
MATGATIPALARAYAGLVVVELALKEALKHGHRVQNLRHDVPEMLQRLGKLHPNCRAALNQHRSDLANKLSALHAQEVTNTPGFVRHTAYPDLRYLRHSQDWKTSASTDRELDTLRACVDRIRHFLRNNVRLPEPI